MLGGNLTRNGDGRQDQPGAQGGRAHEADGGAAGEPQGDAGTACRRQRLNGLPESAHAPFPNPSSAFLWRRLCGPHRIQREGRGPDRPDAGSVRELRPSQTSQGDTMDSQDLNRRAFGKLAAAALGGLVAGAGLVGAADAPKPKDKNKPLMAQEPHICRGLNTCKGKGKGGKNDCAGSGDCATAKAHTCAGDNDCAGLGGCRTRSSARREQLQGHGRLPRADQGREDLGERPQELRGRHEEGLPRQEDRRRAEAGLKQRPRPPFPYAPANVPRSPGLLPVPSAGTGTMHPPRLGYANLGLGVGLRTVHFPHILQNSAAGGLVRDHLRELHGLRRPAALRPGTGGRALPRRHARRLDVHRQHRPARTSTI